MFWSRFLVTNGIGHGRVDQVVQLVGEEINGWLSVGRVRYQGFKAIAERLRCLGEKCHVQVLRLFLLQTGEVPCSAHWGRWGVQCPVGDGERYRQSRWSDPKDKSDRIDMVAFSGRKLERNRSMMLWCVRSPRKVLNVGTPCASSAFQRKSW